MALIVPRSFVKSDSAVEHETSVPVLSSEEDPESELLQERTIKQMREMNKNFMEAPAIVDTLFTHTECKKQTCNYFQCQIWW